MPVAAATTPGSSQFPGWAANTSAPLPSSRKLLKRSITSGEISTRRGPLRVVEFVVPQLVEMGDLDADAAEIVPGATQDARDLGGGLLREGRGEIAAGDLVLR